MSTGGGTALSPLTPVLRVRCAPAARFGRNRAAFNSPSRLGEGWRGRPVRAPGFASSASPGAVTGAPQVVR